jgi:hypothetical protein
VFDHIEVPDGRVWLKQSGVKHFAGDLPEAEQKLVYATQEAPVADLFNQKVEGTAWKSKPSWYVLATQDQTVHPDLQHFVSKRMKAATTEVTASHVPHVIEASCGTRCHPQGRERSLSALMSVCNIRFWRTFETCRMHRAMAGFKGKAENMCSY